MPRGYPAVLTFRWDAVACLPALTLVRFDRLPPLTSAARSRNKAARVYVPSRAASYMLPAGAPSQSGVHFEMSSLK